MSILRFKKTSPLLAMFFSAYFLLGFVTFAFVLAIFVLVFLTKRRIHVEYIWKAGIPELAAIILIALLSTFALSPFPLSAWNTGKDLYFFSSPILILLLGLMLIKKPSDIEPILLTAIKILTIISIALFGDFLLSGQIFNLSLGTRYAYQLDSTASTIALLLIISLRPTLRSLTKNSTLFALAIMNLILILGSLSRVNLSITLISLLFVYSRSRLVRGAIVVAIMLLIAAPLLQSTQIAEIGTTGGEFGFFEKLLNSQQELRVANYFDFASINENWRGYEAYLGIEQVVQVGGWANLLGLGFGSFAVGPFSDKLTEIPYFHNGFVTIFLKSGAIGILIFALFTTKLILLSRSASLRAQAIVDPRIDSAAQIIILLTISLLLRTIATHGVYFARPPMELFFIGIAIFVIGNLRRTTDAIKHSPFLSKEPGTINIS